MDSRANQPQAERWWAERSAGSPIFQPPCPCQPGLNRQFKPGNHTARHSRKSEIRVPESEQEHTVAIPRRLRTTSAVVAFRECLLPQENAQIAKRREPFSDSAVASHSSGLKLNVDLRLTDLTDSTALTDPAGSESLPRMSVHKIMLTESWVAEAPLTRTASVSPEK
jgi:hypothetical protein